MNIAKKAMLFIVLVALVGVCFVLNYLHRLGPIPAGYVSHAVCSGVFIAGRELDAVLAQDVTALQRRMISTVIEGSVITSKFGVWPFAASSQTVYRSGLGCARLGDGSIAELQGPASLAKDVPLNSQSWPAIEANPSGVDTGALAAALDKAFTDDAVEYEQRQNTRAVVIFHKGQLIAERYGEGFGPEMPLNSWSMTKSMTSALVGVLVGKGKINLTDKPGLTGWDKQGDLRSKVTVEHLLHMTSGLEFNEGYENDPISDVNHMLMDAKDMVVFAEQYPVSAEPGSRWAYQTASPVLLGKVIRNSFSSVQEYYHFPQRELFNKLGMSNAHYQMDGGGTYVGGAMLYATARDWARFGLLYLNNGVVNGERILPEGWVRLSTTPTPASLKARAYAAQFWLNSREAAEPMMPKIPTDAYAARGHYGQSTFIIPSRDAVIVRMGQSFTKEAWDMEAFLVDVLAALPQ